MTDKLISYKELQEYFSNYNNDGTSNNIFSIGNEILGNMSESYPIKGYIGFTNSEGATIKVVPSENGIIDVYNENTKETNKILTSEYIPVFKMTSNTRSITNGGKSMRRKMNKKRKTNKRR
jgi:hypothetical protein